MIKIFSCIVLLFSVILAKPSLEILKISNEARSNFDIYNLELDNKDSSHEIQIAIPKNLQSSKVIFLLDGTSFFPRFINKYNSYVVVGIGHKGDVAFDRKRRTYDYLPQSNLQGSGGAYEFLSFIKDRVLPLSIKLIEDKIKTNIDSKILFGHSFGGIFTLYTLLEDSLLFDEYFIVSPSLWSEPKFGSLEIKECPKFVYYLWGGNEAKKTQESMPHINFAKDFALKNPKCNISYKEVANKNHGEMIEAGFFELNLY